MGEANAVSLVGGATALFATLQAAKREEHESTIMDYHAHGPLLRQFESIYH